MKEHVLPAIRNMKDLEKLIQTDYKVCVLLDMHVGHLRSIIELLKKHDIEAYIHIDLIKGMAHDEYACEYIIQTYKPKGIVSTKTKVIQKAKSLKLTNYSKLNKSELVLAIMEAQMEKDGNYYMEGVLDDIQPDG